MRTLLSVLLIALSVTPAFAGGPSYIGSSIFGLEGRPMLWDNSKIIHYRVDGGLLGPLANATAITHVNQAFQKWVQVPGASLQLQNDGAIQGVADGNVDTAAEFNSVLSTCDSGQQSPIILDNGVLVQQLTGDANVLGFSGACNIDSATGHITSAFSLLGAPPDLSTALLDAEIVHELGHFLGLDHTDTRRNFTGTEQADIDGTATMFYLLLTPNMSTLKPDDKAWIAKLYPSATFNSTYGTITGQVLFSDGISPVQDALVIARSLADPHVTILSSISGYRFTPSPGQKFSTDYMPCVPATECTGGTWGDNPDSTVGSHDPALIGFYEIPVPPGQYQIEVHRLLDDGSLGPFDPPLPFPAPEEFWNADESNHDWDTSAGYIVADANPGTITVSAGQIVSGINIILNDQNATYDVFEQTTPTSASEPVKPVQGNAGGAK